MADFGWGSYLIGLALVALAFSDQIKRWWFNRIIRKCIAFDRICRLADIGEKHLTYNIEGSYTYRQIGANSKNGRRFAVQFVYLPPFIQDGNPIRYAGKVQEFGTTENCMSIEETIAEAIIKIKADHLEREVN